ncbi:hypothetical protein AXG93_1543s1000 [Marchantia polymorpha subsp. ruderalis]|uniref:U1-type domain-containing protein n=1 Tax=Marchantia polymorpha subsp. ruderalis TaxID=1480154 RepID=A0A176VZX1_MARPO|nr:hypothetical protein AXG93_1543s1000 [Marchantia polymorpha subsp. ruderalis]
MEQPKQQEGSAVVRATKNSEDNSSVDNTFRRKWNREEYLERVREAEQRELDEERYGPKARGPPVQRKPLKHRDYEVDLTSRLGKTQACVLRVIAYVDGNNEDNFCVLCTSLQVVTQVAPLSQQAGYFCSVCECVVKDSANYLDHINGKKHQRALGMSMRVERATLQQVQDRFDVLKRKKDTTGFTEQDLDMRVLKQQQEEEERKKQRREKKKEKKKEKPSGDDGTEDFDAEMAATMGFGGFGSSKK